MIGWFWKASYGCYEAEHAGAICRSDTPAPAPVGGVCVTGKKKTSGSTFGASFSLRSMAQGRLNWDEVFMDGSFASAKKGGSAWVKPNVAKVQSGWWWQTAKVYLWEVDSLAPRPRKSLLRKKP